MSDSYLFQSKKNGWQLLVFGTSITDAGEYAKHTHPVLDMAYVSKNPTGIDKYVCCACTEKQAQLNRESLYKILEEN